ncbi:MAG: hypothetical protein MZW92_72080 [Comamonadaceae bacterium]|nr:hypothetical protein [Comamonadaceae bacterium]
MQRASDDPAAAARAERALAARLAHRGRPARAGRQPQRDAADRDARWATPASCCSRRASSRWPPATPRYTRRRARRAWRRPSRGLRDAAAGRGQPRRRRRRLPVRRPGLRPQPPLSSTRPAACGYRRRRRRPGARRAGREPLPLIVDGRAAWLQARDPATGGDDAVASSTCLDRPSRRPARQPGPQQRRCMAIACATASRGLDAACSDLLDLLRARMGEALNRGRR